MHRAWAGSLFLLVVAAVMTFPFWYAYSGQEKASGPIVKPASGECIESADVMRRTHMKMLYQWRDEVVRSNPPSQRDYVNSKGVHFNKSLTGTCMNCHTSREEFCDRCHETVSAKPNCFSCHNASPGKHDAGQSAPRGDSHEGK